MKKILVVLAIILAVLTPLMAQAAKEDQHLVVYASVDEANTVKLLDAFMADTGITVDYVHLSSGPAFSRIEAEAGKPQADLWFGAPSDNHMKAKAEGLTVEYKSAAWENLDAQFKDAEGYWRVFYINPICFGINMTALEKAGVAVPKSWADLLKPEYKGLIQAPTPQSAGTGKNMVYGLIELMGEDAAFEYMAKLNANIQTYTSSGTGPSKAVKTGDCAIGIQFTPAFFQHIAEGANELVVFPTEGVSYEEAAISILKGAQNLEAAKTFIDWMTSKKGQDAMAATQTYNYPIMEGAALGQGMPEFASIKTIKLDMPAYAARMEEIVERWVNSVLTAK